MNPLNDDELNALLQQAKAKLPHPSPELAARTMRAYRGSVARPTALRLVFGALAAVLLILIGALGDRLLRAPVVRTRTVEVPVVYRECPAEPPGSSPQIATLTFKEMRPVRQIRPRVVRSIRDDQ
jgi:hypothetical protein